jgi:hypothetical protein
MGLLWLWSGWLFLHGKKKSPAFSISICPAENFFAAFLIQSLESFSFT